MPARSRFQRFSSAATHALRLLISKAMAAAESASRSSRTLVQTTAFHVGAADEWPRRSLIMSIAGHVSRAMLSRALRGLLGAAGNQQEF